MEIGTRVRTTNTEKIIKGTVVEIGKYNLGVEWDNGLYTYNYPDFMVDCALPFPEWDLCHSCKDFIWCASSLRERIRKSEEEEENVNP